MNPAIPRRRALHLGLGIAAGLALPAARACELLTSTLRVTHPWTRATAHGATSAVVCMKFDEVIAADRLILVESPVAAAAEMGGLAAGEVVNFFIPTGQESYLHEAGTFVRLVGLRFAMEVGRSYPLTLGFEKGGVFNTSLSVDYTRFT